MTLIANELDRLNIKPRYRDTWSKSTISDILSNPVYIGKIRWSYRKTSKLQVNGELKEVRKINDECYCIDGIHPSIIEESIFYKAQEVKKKNTRKTTKASLVLKNPLSGLIYCSKCNSLMTRLSASDHTNYDTIKCTNKHCDNISAPISAVENKLINELNIWLSEYEIEIDRNINQSNENYDEVKQNSIQSLKKEIGLIDKQISQTYDLLEREIYTVEIFAQRNQELNNRKAEFTNTILELEEQQRNESELTQIKNNFIPKFKKILYEYPQIKSAKEKNEILKLILERVEYLKTTRNKKGQLNNDNFELIIKPKLPSLP
jgi:hypothetical protein